MPSQVSQYGDQAAVNQLSGQATVSVNTSQPGSWVPGTYWVNASPASVVSQFNGSSWQSSPVVGTRYLALLTQDPVANGVVNMTDAGFVECLTSGYARQTVVFTQASATYPSTASNNALITFTMTNTMILPVQWVALVTVSSGTSGIFLASWLLAQAYTVSASQSIQIGINQLILQGN